MSDIVTTLQDKDGNNIYPIAGGINGNTITAGMLQNNAIETSKVNDLAITTAKIAGNAITTAKVADGAITNDKIELSLIDVPIEFYNGQTYAYTVNAKLLRIGNIGRLMYNGTTGIWHSGGGYANIRAKWPSLTMDKVLTYSCQATQAGNVGAALKYNFISATNATEIDTYLDYLRQDSAETFMAIDITFEVEDES